MSHVTHKAEIAASTRIAKKIREMHDSISPSKHPRNPLTTLYRTTRKLIFQNFDNPTELRNILFLFSNTVSNLVESLFTAADSLGENAGLASLKRRKILPGNLHLFTTNRIIPATTTTIELAILQVNRAIAVSRMGGAVELVIGDGANSVGFFSQGILNKQINGYLTSLVLLAQEQIYIDALVQEISENVFYKQAVAVVDQFVTQTCLLVHGQVQLMDNDFQLVGSPRFADALPNPPFHWHCRTALALVHASERFDEITQQMIEAAASETRARGDTDTRVEINPAHATSGR